MPAEARIGHAHLNVAHLPRALDFHCGVVGFERPQGYGSQAAFVFAGGYHHHIGLNTWESAGGLPPTGTTEFYHLAILYPTRAALSKALHRLLAAGIAIEGASDHGVSEALYLRDPDGRGVELYWDRPPEAWQRASTDKLAMFTRQLDIDSLLKEAEAETNALHADEGPKDL